MIISDIWALGVTNKIKMAELKNIVGPEKANQALSTEEFSQLNTAIEKVVTCKKPVTTSPSPSKTRIYTLSPISPLPVHPI